MHVIYLKVFLLLLNAWMGLGSLSKWSWKLKSFLWHTQTNTPKKKPYPAMAPHVCYSRRNFPCSSQEEAQTNDFPFETWPHRQRKKELRPVSLPLFTVEASWRRGPRETARELRGWCRNRRNRRRRCSLMMMMKFVVKPGQRRGKSSLQVLFVPQQ